MIPEYALDFAHGIADAVQPDSAAPIRCSDGDVLIVGIAHDDIALLPQPLQELVRFVNVGEALLHILLQNVPMGQLPGLVDPIGVFVSLIQLGFAQHGQLVIQAQSV